ncbi:PD40 domain-containing protein [Nostoc sp. UHCC 0702]|nr:PD40 domain-containing protein [Nostoc sp. UHCC 0702]
MASEWAAQVTGINYYPKYTTLKPLTAAAEDAEKVAEQLEKYGYRPFRAQCLPITLNQKGEGKIDRGGAVKVQELQEAIANLFNPPPPNPVPETALFFFSGHGWCRTVAGKEEVFLVTSDVLPEAEIYGIPLSWLGEQLQISQAKRVIVWLDCCYSGELLKFIPTNKDYCLITATRSYETGVEIPHTQGLLTQALLAGLNPENDPDGIINSHKLADFIISGMPDTVQRPLIANSPRAILLTTKFSRKSFQDKCPYRSLSYFSETKEDAEVFYGRSALTQQLIQQVKEQHRLVAVLGGSGSGKSSLLRAGLFYQLKLGQEIPGSDAWTYITPFTPKENPVNSLHEAFALSLPHLFLPEKTATPPPTPPRERGGERLRQQMRGGVPAISLGEELKALNTPVILIIDQFEECFTMCDDSQRQEFFDCLRELIDCTDNLYIFIGMRSDFRARWREYPEYAARIHKPYINVEHLNRQEIEEAITKPAEWVGLGIEGRLKQQLINDVEDYPGSLPLLQYTLTELWRESRNQGDEVVSLKTYEDLGGVEGTLQKRADAVYDSLSPTEKTVARRIFLELTQMGETTDVRRRVRLGELVNSHHSLELLQQVSEKLADKDARLITKTDEPDSQDVILDVVHEALIRHWQMLRDWKEKYKVGIAIERQIEAEAQEWERNDKKPGFLRKDDRLALAEAYLARFGDWQMLNGVAEEYIQKSQELRNRLEREEKERTKRLLTVASITSVFFAGLALFAGFEAREAQIGQVNFSRQSAEAQLLSVQELDALLESVRTIKLLKHPLLQLFPPTDDLRKQVQITLIKVFSKVTERNRLQGNQRSIKSVSFSPDSKVLATGGDDGVRIWNLQGKELKAGIQGEFIQSVSFSPDSKVLAASGGEDGTIKLWSIDDGKVRTLQHGSQVSSVSFSPHDNILASGGKDGTIKLWSIDDGKVRTLTHGSAVLSVSFSPHDNILASGGSDGTIKLWSIDDGKVRTLTHSSGKEVESISFSPDGKMLASGSYDKTIKLWSTVDGKQLNSLKGHSDAVRSVVWSPDGQMLTSASIDKTVIIWSIEGNILKTIQNDSWIESAAWNPKSKILAFGSDDGIIKLWNFEGKEVKITTGHMDAVRSVNFSPDGKMLASGSDDGTIKLWRTVDGEVSREIPVHSGKVYSVAWSADGKMLASGSEDGTVKLWSTVDGKELWNHKKNYSVRSVSFSPDGKLLAWTSGRIIKLRSKGDKEIRTLKRHNKEILSVSFSHDSKMLASGSRDGTIKLWNLTNNKQEMLTGHRGEVRSVAWSPDGKLLASGSTDNTLKLWNLENRRERWTQNGGGGFVYSVSFSPNGKLLASASDNGTIKFWNLEGKEQMTLKRDNSGVRSIAWSPDSKLLASGSNNKTVLLWNLELMDENIALKRGCEWLHDYLTSNPTDKDRDRTLCNGIPTKSN